VLPTVRLSSLKECSEVLTLGHRCTQSNINVSPDIKHLILRVDWMQRRGQVTWDFCKGKVRLGRNLNWFDLSFEQLNWGELPQTIMVHYPTRSSSLYLPNDKETQTGMLPLVMQTEMTECIKTGHSPTKSDTVITSRPAIET